MAVDARTSEIKLIRPADGLEVDLLTLQGLWTEEQYLRLSEQTNLLIEFTDGDIEVLAMPTEEHQGYSAYLYEALLGYIRPRGGRVRYAPLRLQIRPGKHREPDLLLVRDASDPRRQNRYWLGADLVVEIVSPDDPERDTVVKRADYAEARIPEYWIVNPPDETIIVLVIRDDAYATHGVFRRGERATSLLLDGFGVSVDEVFDGW